MRLRPTGSSLVLAGSLCFSLFNAACADTLFKQATLFDGTGKKPFVADVLVKDGRISQIAASISDAGNAEVIDASGKAMLPGFFDIHVHWTPGGEPPSIPAIAEQYVIHGVTTVTDFHSAPESYAPKRAWLANLSAPHVAFAARMSTPGGHGAMWADNHTTYKISTPEDAAVAMKTLAPYKPDLIKLFADGWRYGRKEENTSMDELTMKGMADAAHPLGLPVVAHVVTVDRAKKAAGAGVDVLVHAVQDGDADEELVQAMLSANMTYSPSLAVYEVTEAKKAYYDEEALAMADNRQKHSMYNLKLFSEAGIPVATGTDAGMPKTPHGSSTHREMELLVAGGLTPEQALVAATRNSAAAQNLLDDRGTLEAGKRADLVIIDGTPWESISDTRKVEQVWIDGELKARNNTLVTPQPEGLPAAVKATALIDDFESSSGRTALNTVYINHRDTGVGHSRSLSQRVPKEDGSGYAYFMQAALSNKEEPEASVRMHFTPGAVVPVDASAYKGITLSVRGEGAYFVSLTTGSGECETSFSATPAWQTVQLPFSAFCDGKLDSAQLLMLETGKHGKAGDSVWMSMDDISFY